MPVSINPIAVLNVKMKGLNSAKRLKFARSKLKFLTMFLRAVKIVLILMRNI